MKTITDITKGDHYPTVNVYDVGPLIERFVQILQQVDNTSLELTILGIEKVKCTSWSVPLSIEKLIVQYPNMTHYSIIQEAENNKNYKEYVGRKTSIVTS